MLFSGPRSSYCRNQMVATFPFTGKAQYSSFACDLALQISTVVCLKSSTSHESLGILFKCKLWLSRSRWGLGSWLPNKLPGDAGTAGLWTPLCSEDLNDALRQGEKTSSASSCGNPLLPSQGCDPRLLLNTATCHLFLRYTKQNLGSKKTECIHTEHKSPLQVGNHRAYQERSVPLCQAAQALLKNEIWNKWGGA